MKPEVKSRLRYFGCAAAVLVGLAFTYSAVREFSRRRSGELAELEQSYRALHEALASSNHPAVLTQTSSTFRSLFSDAEILDILSKYGARQYEWSFASVAFSPRAGTARLRFSDMANARMGTSLRFTNEGGSWRLSAPPGGWLRE